MKHKYEPLPLHLCEMLEQEFEKIHGQSSGNKWELEAGQIKDAERLRERWNKWDDEMRQRLVVNPERLTHLKMYVKN